jgi:hypothetical protein
MPNDAAEPEGEPSNAGHWRRRAQELRAIALESEEPEVRELMFKMAADYDRLAELAER